MSAQSAISFRRLLYLLESLATKQPVRLVATTELPLSGLASIDDETVEAGDAILPTAQSNALDNVVWIAAAGPWQRRDDFRVDRIIIGGTSVRVTDGSQAGSTYYVAGPGDYTVGVDELSWEREVPMTASDRSLLDGATANATASTLAKRAADGSCDFASVLNCALVEGVDATVANSPGGNVSWRSGAPLDADVGERNRGHYVTYHGLPASANAYQSGMIVLKCGEDDNPTNRPEGVWDAMDNGFVGSSGYDTDGGGVERTPYYYRIQAGRNPTTLKGIAIRIDAAFSFVVTSGRTFNSREVTGVGAYFLDATSKNSPSGASTGDGTGVLHYRFHRRVTTSGAETKRLATLTAYTINNVFAYNQAVLIAHMAGDTREIYRFDFDWLGGAGVINGPTSMASGISKSALAGRVALSNSGNELRIDVTGLSTKDLIWTLILDQYQEIL